MKKDVSYMYSVVILSAGYWYMYCTFVMIPALGKGKGEFGCARKKGKEVMFLSFLPCTTKFPLPPLTLAMQATVYSYFKKGCPKKINVHTTIPTWDMINTHYTVGDIL